MSTAKETQDTWYALDLDVEPEAREAVEYALMEAAALGTEVTEQTEGMVRVTGYFAALPERERVRQELFEALRIYELPSSSVRDLNAREVANRDWLEEWKKGWQPVEAGRFIIAPPWAKLGDTHDRLVIRIEPGMAFGTGTHETTRLCLDALQKHFGGGSFLDVGTGTGILAIAAAKLFPDARVEACDIDAEAIGIARANAEANQGAERITFRVGSINEKTRSADLVCANLTAEAILAMLPTLMSLSCGRVILSGILASQTEMMLGELAALGILEVKITRDGEWVALTV